MEKKKLLITLLLSVFVSYVNAQFCKQLTSEEQSKAKKRINIEGYCFLLYGIRNEISYIAAVL